jgi:hypothetical protein
MKRKIAILASSIIVLLVSIFSFTYSWLSINTLVFVTSLSVEVYQGPGLNASIDGVHFKQNLTQNDMVRAIVVKYKGLKFNDLGEIVDENDKIVDISETDFVNYYNEIKLNTVTSMDGKEFYLNKYLNQKTDVTTGKFIQFDLYFKSLADGVTQVFLNTSDYNFDENGKRIKKTQISSPVIKTTDDKEDVRYLVTDFQTQDANGEILNIEKGTVGFEVYAKDAMRFSIQTEADTKIYELSKGLGSYSTSLDSSKYEAMYIEASACDANKSAGFTYVKNQKKNEYEPLDFDKIPLTYKRADSYESGVISTIIGKDQVEKVMFTYWLEGYDADCFDVIIGASMDISLSFTTKADAFYNELFKINYHNGDEVITFNYFDSVKIEPILPVNYNNKIFTGWYQFAADDQFDFDNIPYEEDLELNLYARWR